MTRIPRNPEAVLLARHRACDRCRLSALRRHVVIGRGVIPAELLFVGIGPGASEDLRGTAFFGRAGIVLNKAVVDASERSVYLPSIYMTNVVACRPWDGMTQKLDPESGMTMTVPSDNRDPWPVEAAACRPRLHETVVAVQPQKIIALGSYVRQEITRSYPDAIHLQHPAFIVREGVNSPYYRRFVAGLADVFAALREEGK